MTKYVVISDIHGNYPALQAVIQQSEVDNYICTGDITGLMGFSAEVVETVRENCDYVVKGNHDVAVIEQNRGLVSNKKLSTFELRTVQEALTDEQKQWISSLDPYEEIHEEGILMTHRILKLETHEYQCGLDI
jgi:predicted phosphodiesterase